MELILKREELLRVSEEILANCDSAKSLKFSVENIACFFTSSYKAAINLGNLQNLDYFLIDEFLTESLTLDSENALKYTFTEAEKNCSEDRIWFFNDDKDLVFSVDDSDLCHFKEKLSYYSFLKDIEIGNIISSNFEFLVSTKLRYLSDSFYSEPLANSCAVLLTKKTLKHHPGMTDDHGVSVLNHYKMIYSGGEFEVLLDDIELNSIAEAIQKYTNLTIASTDVQKILALGNHDINRVFYQIVRYVNDTYPENYSITQSLNVPFQLNKKFIIKEIINIEPLISALIKTGGDRKVSSLILEEKVYFDALQRLKDMNIVHELMIKDIREEPLMYFDLLHELSGSCCHTVYSWFDKKIV